MKQYILNGRNMTTREAAYDEIIRVFCMPAHFGRNLDALWDELSCMQGEIICIHSDALTPMGEYGQRLIATFTDAAKDNDRLSFSLK